METKIKVEKQELLNRVKYRYDLNPFPDGPDRMERAVLGFLKDMAKFGTGYFRKRETAKEIIENTEKLGNKSDLQNRLDVMNGEILPSGRPSHPWFSDKEGSSYQYTIFFNDWDRKNLLFNRTMTRKAYEDSLAEALREGRSSDTFEYLKESLMTPYGRWGFNSHPNYQSRDLTEREWRDYKEKHLNPENIPSNIFGDVINYFRKK